MRIEGKLIKSGNWWAVEVPLLLLHTQGKTKKEAYFMAKDAIECAIDKKGFKVEITQGENNTFVINANDDASLMAFALEQHRENNHLTIRDVAKNLGKTSPNEYNRYAKAKVRNPSIEKFSQLMKAINPKLEPIIKI